LRITFESHIYDSYSSSKAKDIIKKIDWEIWINKAGLPPFTANFTSIGEQNAVNLANEYIKLGGASSPSGFLSFKTWPNNQKMVFAG